MAFDYADAFSGVSEQMVLYEELPVLSSVDYTYAYPENYAPSALPSFAESIDSQLNHFLTPAPADLINLNTSAIDPTLLSTRHCDLLPSPTAYESDPSSTLSPLSAPASPLRTSPLDFQIVNRITRFSVPVETSSRPHTQYVRLLSSTEDMMYNWTAAETRCGRRLVRFSVTRHEDGHRMVACRAISPSEYTEDFDLANTFSYIARPSGGFVITSVDLLHLAELLYGDKSSIPEKNRLRRHLERLHPQCVGRHRDNGGLYSRIAAFDKPRPLSITKDVKVFNWAKLPQALEFIMAKRVSYLLHYCVYIVDHLLQIHYGV